MYCQTFQKFEKKSLTNHVICIPEKKSKTGLNECYPFFCVCPNGQYVHDFNVNVQCNAILKVCYSVLEYHSEDCATSCENMSSEIFDQVRFKPA